MKAWGYRLAWAFCLGVYFCHILSLPLVANFDSNWYVRLADVLGTKLFASQWDYLRGPLFPAMLKFSFWVWGRQAMAVFGLQACFACAGIWLLVRNLRTMGLVAESSIAVVVLAAFPTLIVYQHILLTEVGTFFFFSLIVFLAARPAPASLKDSMLIGMAIGVGYYHRSSLVYFGPLIGCIYVLPGLRHEWMLTARDLKNQILRRSLPQFLIIAVLPFLLAYPWQRNPKVTTANGLVLFYGLVTQGVLPFNDPILGAAAPAYVSSIEHAKSNGIFPTAGIADGSQYPVIDALAKYDPIAGSIFARVISNNTSNYLKAVQRNLIIFCGLKGFSYDNAVYANEVLFSTVSHIDPGGVWMTPLGKEFIRTSAPNLTASALQAVLPLYNWLVEFGLLATMAGLFIGAWRWDKAILAFTTPALAFILLHALVLASQDRMIVPVQPILLLNLVLLPTWLGVPPYLRVKMALYRGYLVVKVKHISRTAIICTALTVFGLSFLGFMFFTFRADRLERARVVSLTGLTSDLNGLIEGVNNEAPAHLDDTASPTLLIPGQSLVVEGWLSYQEPSIGSPLEEIEGVVNGNGLAAQVIKRPDVALFFHNARMTEAGFRFTVKPGMLAPGLTRIDIVGRPKGTNKLHRFPHSLYVLSR